MCDQQRLRPACAHAQSDQSLCLSLAYFMSVKLLTEHNLEFLSLKEGCTGSSESTHVKMPRCWKSHVAALVCVTYNHAQVYFPFRGLPVGFLLLRYLVLFTVESLSLFYLGNFQHISQLKPKICSIKGIFYR